MLIAGNQKMFKDEQTDSNLLNESVEEKPDLAMYLRSGNTMHIIQIY